MTCRRTIKTAAASASDRVLPDDEWRAIARDLLDRTGIAPGGDTGACRWVMVRHADDHVHVAAVLVQEDRLRRYHPRSEYLRVRETCLAAEEAYGLTRTAPADRTAVPGISRAEIEKASSDQRIARFAAVRRFGVGGTAWRYDLRNSRHCTLVPITVGALSCDWRCR